VKSNADTELDLQAVKHAFSLGKSKPVKPSKPESLTEKLMIFGQNLTKELAKESSTFHSS
jgi:hypothetical protein